MAQAFGFELTHRDGRARRGLLTTAHGTVETPAFMPVGTRGAVKGVTFRDVADAGAQIILANTYHLHLRPGDDLVAELGGLHRFIGWDGPILTDSGGYQVFSLAATRVIDEEGVRFRSHIDGSQRQLTPERAVEIQGRLGSDLTMAFDECPAYPATEEAAGRAMERTLRWARRGRERFEALRSSTPGESFTNPGQVQFGIVQGGAYPQLRERSVRETTAMGFAACAIGGLSVGEPVELMYEVVDRTAGLLPEQQPRYLMGTGMPDDLIECVARGIDLFDCVLPTRNGRNGQLFTREGRLSIKNARYARDERPPDPACACYTCRHCSRAYLRHLFVSGEMTGATLNSLHNLHFYLDTLASVRKAIVFGRFEHFRLEFLRTFSRRSAS